MRLPVALVAISSTILLTGCGSLLRQAVNHRFPPVSPEMRQLGAIQAEEKSFAVLGDPSAYSFLSSTEINNYFETVLAQPIPLDKNASAYLATPPTLTGAYMTFGEQEVALVADFFVEFSGQHQGIDINGISVSGNLAVRLFPELVPSSDPSIATAVRLRPAISSVEICKLDLSKSSHKTLYWFERRDVLSTVLNSAFKAFRDNINGQLHLDLPIPLGAVKIGRNPGDSNDGVVISPPTLAAIQPQFVAGVVKVSPKGLVVLAKIRLDVLDPSAIPVNQVSPSLPPESLPKQAPKALIDTEFSKLENLVDSSIVSNFGSIPDGSNELLIKKSLIANAINTALDPKQMQISYASSLEEYGPKTDADRELHLPDKPNLHCGDLLKLSCDDPRGTCVPFLVQQAQQHKSDAENACRIASNAIGSAEGAINSACQRACVDIPWVGRVCAGDLVAPGVCESAKVILATNRAALAACQTTVDFTSRYLSAPQDITDELTQKLGLGPLDSTVCKQYDKIFNGPQCRATQAAWNLGCGTVQATIDTLLRGQVFATFDWQVTGSGNAAIKATASLSKTHVSDNLDRVDITGVTGSGSLTVEGWAKFTPKPEFYPICPPPPCLPGHDCRIILRPTTINATLADDHVGGAFGVASYPADGYPNGRNGFFIAPDSFNGNVALSVSPIGKLIRENALQLPCMFNGVLWTTYSAAEVISFTGADINLTHNFDLGRKRIAWADSQVELPTSWKNIDGQIQVVDRFKLPVNYSIENSSVVAQAGQIPAPSNTIPPAVYRRPKLLEIAAGLGTGFVLASRVAPRQSLNFWSPVIPYATVSYKYPYLGLFGAIMPGPKAGDFAGSVGLALRPFEKADRFNLLIGTRIGPSTSSLQTGPQFMFAVGWDLGRLALRGCEQCK